MVKRKRNAGLGVKRKKTKLNKNIETVVDNDAIESNNSVTPVDISNININIVNFDDYITNTAEVDIVDDECCNNDDTPVLLAGQPTRLLAIR